eukprot:998658-Lingulodinium_polyedra.AAC.1
MSRLAKACKRALRRSMKNAFRCPRPRLPPARRRVAKSEGSNRTASKRGVAANMASSFHLA